MINTASVFGTERNKLGIHHGRNGCYTNVYIHTITRKHVSVFSYINSFDLCEGKMEKGAGWCFSRGGERGVI